MLEDFLRRFKTVIDGLMSHPRVRVTHLWIGPPATDAAMAALAERWEQPLPAALAALYRQADGVQLRWVDTGDEMYDPARDDQLRFDGPWRRLCDERGVITGMLDLPTVAELLDRDTVGSMGDMGDGYEYLDRAVPFDSFSECQDAVLFFGDEVVDPWIDVASDSLADVDPPGALTLSRYLGRVLSSWASIDHRLEEGPRSLDSLLRERVFLDPTRLVGQRVLYVDGRRGGSLIRGIVRDLVTLPEPRRDWWYGPTLAEVDDDLGETVYVPLRALFPADDADDYEPLHADPDALRALLRGPAEPIFKALASVTQMTHGTGLPGGPTICDHAWAHFALTSELPRVEAVRCLFAAALTLFVHPERQTERAIAWPESRPPTFRRKTMCYDTLAVGLFDAAILHIGAAAPENLAFWLGWRSAARLPQLLKVFKDRNRLRGYDPLTDTSKTCGFLVSALRGGRTALVTAAHLPQTGGRLGLRELRVIGL